MKRLMVTGQSGFVGRTVERMVAADPEWSLVGAGAKYDLLEPDTLAVAIRSAEPEFVLHLAAQSFVPAAFADPRATFDVNFGGTLNLFQALREWGFKGRMLFVSSGDIYGLVPDAALPVTEERLPRPRNPYAVSKVAAEALCYQWTQTEDLDAMIARPFNHIGPGQDARFAVSGFAKQVASITLGRQAPVIDVGDIDVTRDLTDVEDVVRAYLLVLAAGKRGETYNVASGRELSMRQVLETLCRLAGIAPDIRQDTGRLRAAEQRRMRASSRKLAAATGWAPRVPLEASIERILEYWITELKG